MPRQLPNRTHPHPLPLLKSFRPAQMPFQDACGINPPFSGLARGRGQVGYALLTRAPVAEPTGCPAVAAPRLACVRPVASVHPEPGSNSALYKYCSLYASECRPLRDNIPAALPVRATWEPHLSESALDATLTARLCCLSCHGIVSKISLLSTLPSTPKNAESGCKSNNSLHNNKRFQHFFTLKHADFLVI